MFKLYTIQTFFSLRELYPIKYVKYFTNDYENTEQLISSESVNKATIIDTRKNERKKCLLRYHQLFLEIRLKE